jgi:glycosyltransferase involved in cell wall biosynthesis
MITVHCLVKNEENYIWYAINSVINYVEKIIIWDTGSTDRTVEIIKAIENPKLVFKEKGEVDPLGVSELRQEMLNLTETDWFFILDGDEIWNDDAIKGLESIIRDCRQDVVVAPNYMLIGDIFHYQEENGGRYRIGNLVGHYNIRAIRNLPGLHVDGVYPNEAYITPEGIKVQNFDIKRIIFLDEPYLHASFLERSSKSQKKIKYEIGNSFPKNFYYPEVFFKTRPDFVPSPWKTMGVDYKFRAFFETPLKKIRRRI